MATKAQTLVWAGQLEGHGLYSMENQYPGESMSQAIAVDDALNVYVAGRCNDTIDFDLGPGQYRLTATSNSLYLAKYDAQGQLVWADLFNGTGASWASSLIDIAFDPEGNITLLARTIGPMDMDPGMGEHLVQSIDAGASQVVIAKYTTEGNLLWAASFNGGMTPAAMDVAIDGSILITAAFYQVINPDPGPGTDSLTSNGHGIYFAKYDANGNYLWGKSLSGVSIYGRAFAIASAPDGSIYLGGSFDATVDFDPGPGMAPMTATGFVDAFLAKYDSNGDFIWSKALAVYQTSYGKYMDLAVDADGSVLVLGDYVAVGADLDPGPGVVTLPGNLLQTSGYFGRFDPDGNLIWGKGIYLFTAPRTIQLDDAGNIYLSGSFNGGDFDPGPAIAFIAAEPSSAFADVWARYDAEGNFCWARTIGNNGYGGSTVPPAFAVKGDHQFLAGSFKQTADLDPGPDTVSFTSTSNAFNSYIARFDSPIPTLDLGPDQTICLGQSVLLDPGLDGLPAHWQDGSQGPTFAATSEGLYWVSSVGTCPVADSVYITVEDCTFALDMPNVFSPNADGVNDLFLPIHVNGVMAARLIVFNRWGGQVFTSDNLTAGWNGRHTGAVAPDGAYFWTITYTNEFTFEPGELHGSVMILR